MSKKGTRALASATLMSLVLTTALSAGTVQAAKGQATRLGEADRYATAAKVATSNWDKAETVVLVNGEGYADAVSGSVLAKKLDAPMLLTAGNALSTETKDALTKLGAKKVYVVGGNASVSATLETELKANYTVTRLGGANRYETNAAVAEELVKLGVDPANVMMVGGEGFSDALSVAPIAAAKDQILLLGMNDANYMSPVVDFVKKHNSKVTVVGTKNVISDAIYSAVGATSRVDGGADRWDTNQKVLAAFKDTVKFDKLYVASAAYNAQDNGFADALVASALAGKYAAPLVLVDKDGSTGTNNALNYIKNNASKTTDLNVVGGTGVVSEAVLNKITEAVNPSKPGNGGDNSVAEINSINLNQFDIVFDSNVDEDTAELESNYKVGSKKLSDKIAHAELINDNTVRITLLRSEFESMISQGDEVTVYVERGILTEDKTQTIEKFSKKIEFKDVTAPTLKSVSVRGNNKLVVEFSEAVNMGNKNFSSIRSLIQVNGKSLSNIDTSISEFKNAISNEAGSVTWSDKVEFYLNTALKSGENTIKVKDASGDVLEDAAGFAFKEAEETVTVDEVSTKPEVKDITCSDDGEIRISFDRPMDAKIAGKTSYFKINDKKISNATVELDDDDTVIKITDVGVDSDGDDILKDTMNVIEITDGVKDAYGNKIEDETRVSFEKEKDETKPTVLSATIIDDETLRVQFSEDVRYTYATNLDNYELKDAYDVDIIAKDKDNVYIVASDAETTDPRDDRDDTDTYDIKFDKTDYKLTSSKYTLTVSDIVDKATDPNKMDDETIDIDGNDDSAPSIDDIVVFRKSATEVSIFFGKEMDSSTLTDKENYFFIDGDGDSEELPDDVDITVSDDNKGVVLDFDDADKDVYVTGDAPKGDEIVKRIGLKNVKDASGNELYVGAMDILADTNDKVTKSAPKIETNSFKLYKDGDDVKAEFKLDTALDTAYEDDFRITSENNSNVSIKPDNAETTGKSVILTFNEGDNADAVMALGTSAKVVIKEGGESEDIAGRSIQKGSQVVYYNSIAPETDRDNYSATIDVDSNSAVINITMKTPVDTDLLGSYKDDFVFTNATKGANLDISKVDQKFVDGKPVLVFTVKDASKVEDEDEINITAALDEDDLDIRTAADGNGKHVDYVPSDDDKKVKKVTAEIGTITPGDVAVDEVTLDKTTLGLQVGAEATLTAAVSPSNATNKDVTWKTSDASVATVVGGKVTAVKAGTATITAEAGGKAATCDVKVTAADEEAFVTGAEYLEELFSSNLYVTVADVAEVTGVTVNGNPLVLDENYVIEDGKVKIVFRKGTAKDAIGTVVIKTADKDYTVNADIIK